jgi:hypothetical protein
MGGAEFSMSEMVLDEWAVRQAPVEKKMAGMRPIKSRTGARQLHILLNDKLRVQAKDKNGVYGALRKV